MKLVYLAGKINAKTRLGVLINCLKAIPYQRRLLKQGYAVHCPHLETLFTIRMFDHEDYMKRDLEILRRCDIVAFMPNWKTSPGAIQEMKLAIKLNKDIIVFDGLKNL